MSFASPHIHLRQATTMPPSLFPASHQHVRTIANQLQNIIFPRYEYDALSTTTTARPFLRGIPPTVLFQPTTTTTPSSWAIDCGAR